MCNIFFVGERLLFIALYTFESEWVKFVLKVSMQGLACVAFLAHRTHHWQYTLSIITDQVLTRRICQLVVITHFLPLFDAFWTKTVLTWDTFFCVKNDHLADATYEMLVKWYRLIITLICSFLSISSVFISWRSADKVSRVNLHYGFICDRLATCHYLINLFIAENEESIGVLLARRSNRRLRFTLSYGV